MYVDEESDIEKYNYIFIDSDIYGYDSGVQRG